MHPLFHGRNKNMPNIQSGANMLFPPTVQYQPVNLCNYAIDTICTITIALSFVRWCGRFYYIMATSMPHHDSMHHIWVVALFMVDDQGSDYGHRLSLDEPRARFRNPGTSSWLLSSTVYCSPVKGFIRLLRCYSITVGTVEAKFRCS